MCSLCTYFQCGGIGVGVDRQAGPCMGGCMGGGLGCGDVVGDGFKCSVKLPGNGGRVGRGRTLVFFALKERVKL